MWMQETSSGKVRFFERYVDRNGEKKVVSVLMPDAKKATQKVASDLLREKMDLPEASGSVVTFGEMVERYKAYLRREMKPQTAYAAEMQFRPIVRMIGEETLLSALSAPLVRSALFDGSASRFNERLKHLKAALRWAYREEMLPSVDFLEKLPKMRTDAHREALAVKFLEADELRMLLDGLKVERWRLLVEFLALSGLRIGEAMALRQADVDLDAREIVVSKTFSLVLGEVSQNAKTDAGNRSVYIQDELLDCVHRINATMPRRRTLFFDHDGFINYPAFSKYFRENTERILGRRLTPHALRHTHVALLAASGIPLDAISRRIGHSSSDVTREVYMHVTRRLRERDADQIRSVRIL